MAMLGLLVAPAVPVAQAAPESGRTVRDVRLAPGAARVTLKGRITGDHYVDYRLRASAGQIISASLAASNRASYFNLLPPGSNDVAMHRGATDGNQVERMLPDDGVYILRVYLLRAEARRNHTSDYTLTVAVTGTALPARAAQVDALVTGTRFHATTTLPCVPPYSSIRQCAAGVVRRGVDGTATVELSWDQGGKRRILFVTGKPAATDAAQAFTVSRNSRGDYVVAVGGDERFEIPEALVSGG